MIIYEGVYVHPRAASVRGSAEMESVYVLSAFLNAPHKPNEPFNILSTRVVDCTRTEINDAVIEVLPSKVTVTRDRLHLKYPLFDTQQRHVERASTQVKYEDIVF